MAVGLFRDFRIQSTGWLSRFFAFNAAFMVAVIHSSPPALWVVLRRAKCTLALVDEPIMPTRCAPLLLFICAVATQARESPDRHRVYLPGIRSTVVLIAAVVRLGRKSYREI